ncbi:MAG: cysteine desulfurase, partial [Myxococcaceae bacterium]|nr:cysteine desulfurase [Myxococcaceae bacterium]
RLNAVRAALAQAFGVEPKEVIFTASGSEAAALAVLGAYRGRADRARTRVVSTAIEHPCVLGSLELLEREGARVVRVRPGPDGAVSADAVIAELTPDTALCSVMWVNNETGVIQPVEAIAQACRARGIPFHTDAVQAVGRTDGRPAAELLSLSGHKLGTPAGVGALLAARALPLQALVPGHQENGLRGGTQAVAMAEALALAVTLARSQQADELARLGALRDDFERAVLARVPGVTVNGAGAPRVATISNLSFEKTDGEALLIALDLEGVCVSTGAACASGSLSPSHVLLAMGRTPAQAHGTLRFSLGSGTTAEALARVTGLLETLAPRCREP